MAWMLGRMIVMLLSSWVAQALVTHSRGHTDEMLEAMRSDHSYSVQLAGCHTLLVDSSQKSAQDEAAQNGAIEAIATAMDLFPEDKTLVAACTLCLSTMILFNRDNGLRAGQLGTLNHTLHIYKQNMDDPAIMSLGGAIGAFFDFVNENRLIARELGGIQAIIQNIKNNFHGQYSDWDYNPVKQSLFALSSGCWVNQDICFNEGFPELAVALMAEHGHEDKIAEETQQATKALIFKSDMYRSYLVDLGITDSMVHVLKMNQDDRGAVTLTCDNFALMVGPSMVSDPTQTGVTIQNFNKTIQVRAAKSGAIAEIGKLLTSGQEMHHKEHSGFNFDVDASYNVNRDCFHALSNLVQDNGSDQTLLRDMGVGTMVLADLQTQPSDLSEQLYGCSLLKELDASLIVHACSAP